MTDGADQPPEVDQYAADAEHLRSFVSVVEVLLQAVIDDGKHIPPAHLQAVRDAWPHARADLRELADALAREASSPMGAAGSSAEPTAVRSKLERHGLTGPSLRMKLGLWRSRVFRFGSRMNRPWLRTALRWSDTILGSLVDAMTLGAAGKEFKEAIEHLLSPDEQGGSKAV